LQLATHNPLVASKMLLPEAVAEHDDVVGAWLKFLRVEKTTSSGRNAEQRRKSAVPARPLSRSAA
jgi:hypothetical protein